MLLREIVTMSVVRNDDKIETASQLTEAGLADLQNPLHAFAHPAGE